jgi:hypothetical protein
VQRSRSTKPHSAQPFLHRVGDGDDTVAQLGVGDAAFWLAATSEEMKRLTPARPMARPAERWLLS